MARSTQMKAFGLRRHSMWDTTWQPLPKSMLTLLVQIAEAEKRLAAQAQAEIEQAATPRPNSPQVG